MRKSAWWAGGLVAVVVFGVVPACATSVTKFGDDGAGGDGSTDSTTSATSTTTTTGAGGTTGHGGSAQGGAGGGGAAPHDAGPPGSCVGPADCVALSDQCNLGTCVDGACVKAPANEFGACDDGQFCTENEACTNGVCGGGTPKVCPGADGCHIGLCDEGSKKCSVQPGNDGAACDDGDPCTGLAVCQAGSCVQQSQKDCSFLNDTCAVGACDEKLGCVKQPAKDGTACDDGLFCTVQDACKAGVCKGVPNTCAAPGDVCMIGTCDEVAKSCVAVPGNDGAKCSTNDPCVGGETCGAGKCQGGGPANEGKACAPADKCQVGTTCSKGVCGGAVSVIAQCINGDGCCPPGCDQKDDDCTPLTKPSYDASITFQDALPGTTMTLTWDGTSFWSCSGGGPNGDRLAQYSAQGALVKTYQPNIDFRAVLTVGGKGQTVYARGYSENFVRTMTAPGSFNGGSITLNGGTLDAQSSLVWNADGSELVAMIGDGGSGATVSRWTAQGALLSTFTLQGFNQNGENAYPQNRGIVVAGKWYLTYANGVLSAWDPTGKRVSSTKLNNAGVTFDSHFSLSYAQNKVFIVDAAGGKWRGYDVGL
jgi:hypothetical protein